MISIFSSTIVEDRTDLGKLKGLGHHFTHTGNINLVSLCRTKPSIVDRLCSSQSCVLALRVLILIAGIRYTKGLADKTPNILLPGQARDFLRVRWTDLKQQPAPEAPAM